MHISRSVARRLFIVAALLGVAQLQSATLQQLSMSDLIAKSTSIVRGTVQGSYTAFSGPVIFTHYRVQVAERWKGSAGATVDVAVPGGVANGIRQTYSGRAAVPAGRPVCAVSVDRQIRHDADYGVFAGGVRGCCRMARPIPSVTRDASHELMLDPATHGQVNDQPVTMRLSELRSQVASALGAVR